MKPVLRGILGACVLALGFWGLGAETAQALTSGEEGQSSPVVQVASPDGRVDVRVRLDTEGRPRYSVRLNGAALVEPSPLGLSTTFGRWTRDLEVQSVGAVESVEDTYTLQHGKCSRCDYQAHRRVVRLKNEAGRELAIVFQVSNDGVAFRYRIPRQLDPGRVTAFQEATGFRFSEETTAWLMPMHDPADGWQQTFPAYEGHYVTDEPVGQPSPTGVGWAFPGLFRRPDVGWALVTEAGLDGSYHASRLTARSDGLYRVAGPEPGEGTGPGDPVSSTFALPFASPWRLVIVGEGLGPIVESSLVTDVSPPSTVEDPSFVEPGTVAWSWLPLKDDSIVPAVQRDFIDMAARYGIEHVLIDNWWDQQIGYEGVRKLVNYAEKKGVGVFLWYNSNGAFNTAPQTPQDRMHTAEARREEFSRLQEMGVRGVKVDFFGGDKQSVIQLYRDLFRDAAAHDLMVNVHGSTLPRGWRRTYPSFMTSEAVRGYEYITFSQGDADQAPRHATVLPFTRNVVGPMDFTPTMLTDTVGVSKRRTSDAFDLAMPVVFESGLQHLGVTPESLGRQPQFVQGLLGEMPAAWDETRFLAGYPGRHVVLARRSGETWYLGGLNGDTTSTTVQVPLDFLDASATGILITDGQDRRSVDRRAVSASPADTLTIELRARGGGVGRFRPADASSEGPPRR